ncbi:hypothetical protein [Glaciecola sp. SC05]|uniref:hypothetical protein n=1 Tax=Glaciecola sp. SC05 TaxID=1987355 RepID=UPI003527C3FE
MNNIVILDNFNDEGIYELHTQLPLRYSLVHSAEQPVTGFGQQFKTKIFSKKDSFIALFQNENKLFISLDGKTHDLTEGDYKFNTEYLGCWKIRFEAARNGVVLFSTVYVGLKSELYSAPMDCNIFQEIIARSNDVNSRRNFIEYYGQK